MPTFLNYLSETFDKHTSGPPKDTDNNLKTIGLNSLFLYANMSACPVDGFNCPVMDQEFVGPKTCRHVITGREKSFRLIGKTRAEHYLVLCLRAWVKAMFVELRNIFILIQRRVCAGIEPGPLSALGLGSSNLLPQLPSLHGCLVWATDLLGWLAG